MSAASSKLVAAYVSQLLRHYHQGTRSWEGNQLRARAEQYEREAGQ